jgi:hypothetical protein
MHIITARSRLLARSCMLSVTDPDMPSHSFCSLFTIVRHWAPLLCNVMSSRRYLSISVVLIKLQTNSCHNADVTFHNTEVYESLSLCMFQVDYITFFTVRLFTFLASLYLFCSALHAYMEFEVTCHKWAWLNLCIVLWYSDYEVVKKSIIF